MPKYLVPLIVTMIVEAPDIERAKFQAALPLKLGILPQMGRFCITGGVRPAKHGDRQGDSPESDAKFAASLGGEP